MRLLRFALLVLAAVVMAPLAIAQATPGSPDSTPAPPQTTPDVRTDSKPNPAQTAPDIRTDAKPRRTQQSPDLRTDSKPNSTQAAPDTRTDSKPGTPQTPDADSRPFDLAGGPARPMDLGFDPNAVAPAGLVARPQPGNPLLLFLSLPERAPSAMSSADAAVVEASSAAIGRAAAQHGYDLREPGWTYTEVLCSSPDVQTGADGAEAAAGRSALLLRYVREANPGERPAFTAVVPHRGDAQDKVRVIAGTGPNGRPLHRALHGRQSTLLAAEVLPPSNLTAQLRPGADWLATAACIAELAGADPQIPNDPDLDREHRITAAPSPRLRLLIEGGRRVYFSDIESPDRFSIWDEWVKPGGRVKEASRKRFDSPVLPVTNPPEPAPRPAVVPPGPQQVAVIVPPEPTRPLVNPPEPQPKAPTEPPEPHSVLTTPPPPPTRTLPLPADPDSGAHQ